MQPELFASEWALQHESARGVRTDLEGLGWDLLQPKLTRSARRHRDDRGRGADLAPRTDSASRVAGRCRCPRRRVRVRLPSPKGGGSATAWAVVAVFAIVFVGWSLIAFWRRRRGTAVDQGLRMGVRHRALLDRRRRARAAQRDPSILGRPAGFDGRVEYWRVSWDGVEIHPLRGWGWLAAWRTPSFRTMLPVELANELWSHARSSTSCSAEGSSPASSWSSG